MTIAAGLRSGKPASAVEIASACTSGPAIGLPAAVLCMSCSTGAVAPITTTLPRTSARVEVAVQRSRKRQATNRSRWPGEVDPATAHLAWIRRAPSEPPRHGRRDRRQPVDIGERVAQHAVGVGDEVRGRGLVADAHQVGVPPEHLRGARGRDERGSEHDGGCPARRFVERFVGSWSRGAIEGDVVHDQASAGRVQVCEHARVQCA